MPRKKMTSAILDANGGLNSARARSKARNILLNHDLKQPVIYHLVFTGSQSIADYQAIIKALVRRLRNAGCRTEYFGAYENDEEKGIHAHCFFLIETSKKAPIKILNVNNGECLHKLAVKHGLNRVHLAKPQNTMHDGQFFARPVGAEKLADCLQRIDYLYKSRSKEGVPSRETYFNSEFKNNTAKRAAKRQSAIPGLVPVAVEAHISLDSEKLVVLPECGENVADTAQAGANFPFRKFGSVNEAANCPDGQIDIAASLPALLNFSGKQSTSEAAPAAHYRLIGQTPIKSPSTSEQDYFVRYQTIPPSGLLSMGRTKPQHERQYTICKIA
jgi:hypothetical protein